MSATLLGNGDGALGAPVVSATTGGRVHLVYRGTDAQIHYRLWNGKKWKADEALPTPTAKNHQPHIVAAPQGGVHVVFVGDTTGGASYTVYYTTRRAKTWSSPTQLSHESFAQLPRIAAAADGALHVVYNRFGDTFQEIYYTHFDGAAWSAPQVIGSGFYPDIALDANGQPMAVWNDKTKLFSAQRGADGVWSAPQRLRGGRRSQTAALIFDAAGVGHLVAQSRAGEQQVLLYASCALDGVFSKLTRVPLDTLAFAMYPRIAQDCNGQLRLVYQAKNIADEPWRVFQSVRDGTSWGAPTRLDAPPMDTINQVPDIDANGGVVAVTWWTRRDPAQEIYADVQTLECAAPPVSMTAILPERKRKTTRKTTRKTARRAPPQKAKPKTRGALKSKGRPSAKSKTR